jgi:hypothetical protein
MSAHVIAMLEAFAPHFPKRHESDAALKEWAQSWVRALKSYDPWVLERAAQEIIDSRDERSHPLIAEVKKVCHEVIRFERSSRPEMKVEHKDQYEDPFKLADALIRCELGREAARANPSWVLALHDFCRENRRLPSSGEISKCRRVAAEFHENYAACVSGRAGPFSKPLEKLGASMIRRTQKLRVMVLGEEAEAA